MIDGRNRAVGIVTDYGMDGLGSKPFFLTRPDLPRDPPTRCLYFSLSYYSVSPFETFKTSLKRFLYHHSFYSIEECYEYNDDNGKKIFTVSLHVCTVHQQYYFFYYSKLMHTIIES